MPPKKQHRITQKILINMLSRMVVDRRVTHHTGQRISYNKQLRRNTRSILDASKKVSGPLQMDYFKGIFFFFFFFNTIIFFFFFNN